MKDKQRFAQMEDFKNEIQDRETENNFVWWTKIIIICIVNYYVNANVNIFV